MNFYSIVYDLALNDNIDLFVDMDDVNASYDFGKPLDFINKRPLKSNIEVLRKISLINNVNLVDDDNQVLQFISSKLKNILLFQDSALVD